MARNNQIIKQLIKETTGQANLLTIPRIYIKIFKNDINTALLLGQIVYWSDRGKDGWFYKSGKDWLEEIGLTQYQVNRSSQKLLGDGVIEMKKKKIKNAPTNHYRLKMEELTDLIIKFLDNGKSINLINQENEETSQSLTEINKDYKESGSDEPKKKDDPSPPEPYDWVKNPKRRELVEAFIEVFGEAYLPSRKNQYSNWNSHISHWLSIGAEAADILKASKAHKKSTIKGQSAHTNGPQSINYRVQDIIAERKKQGISQNEFKTFRASELVPHG